MTKQFAGPKHLPTREATSGHFFHDAPKGITFKDMHDPAYWRGVSRMLRTGARIEVLSSEGWWGELIVTGQSHLGIAVAPVNFADLAPAKLEKHPVFQVVENNTGYAIVNQMHGGDIVKTGLHTQAQANEWLMGNLTSLMMGLQENHGYELSQFMEAAKAA